jgi:hypothetical protein
MQLIFLRHDSEDPVVLEVPDDSDTDLVYQLLSAETGKSFRQEYIEFEGHPIRPGQMLMQLGIVDGSTLFIKPASSSVATASAAPSATSNSNAAQAAQNPSFVASAGEIPADVKPEQLIAICQANPHILTQILASDPELGGTIQLQDIAKLRTIMMKRYMARHKQEYERKQELIRMSEDPMNPEVQKKIEEQVLLHSEEIKSCIMYWRHDSYHVSWDTDSP